MVKSSVISTDSAIIIYEFNGFSRILENITSFGIEGCGDSLVG